MSKTLKRAVIIICICLALCIAFLALCFFKVIHLNGLFTDDYKLRGVDISNYQGTVDWQKLSSQDIDFAYIKATEGSSYTDERFEYNLSEALKTKLYIGAYHFFSFDSSGVSQAEHFIKTVPKRSSMLPPVIDLEYYGDYFSDPKDKEDVIPEVIAMADKLEAHYGVKPVIYATGKSYRKYIKGTELERYPLWIRNVYIKPIFADEWVFWQYADDNKLEGYSGDEENIDMNVFFGNEEQLKNMMIN